jgi:ankyrin repeat protein
MNNLIKFLCLNALLISSASLAMDADLGGNGLCKAAKMGNLELVKTLIDEGTPVNAKNSLGITPLTNAAMYGHVQICQLLLDHNAQVDEIDVHRNTSLIWAADYHGVDQILICHLLIDTTLNQSIQPGAMVALLGMKKFQRSPFLKSIEREIIKQIARQAYANAPKIKVLFAQIDAIQNENMKNELRAYAQQQLKLKMDQKTNNEDSHE